MSVLLDVDKEREPVPYIYYEENLALPHPHLVIKVNAPEELDFNNTSTISDKNGNILVYNNQENTLIYDNEEWAIIRYSSLYSGQSVQYDCLCYPKMMAVNVDRLCKNMDELCSWMKRPLQVGSSSFLFEYPALNLTCRELLMQYRLDSLHKNIDSPKLSQVLYCQSNEMISKSWNDIIQTKAVQFEVGASGIFQVLLGSSLNYDGIFDQAPSYIKYENFLNKMIQDKVIIHSRTRGRVGQMYKLVTNSENTDNLQDLMLIYQKYESSITDTPVMSMFVRFA